jgi:hypothetical protein
MTFVNPLAILESSVAYIDKQLIKHDQNKCLQTPLGIVRQTCNNGMEKQLKDIA